MMRSWIERMKWNLQNWMRGRYGQDALSVFLSRAALVLILISLFFPVELLSILAMACLLWSMFRTFSKKVEKRRRELADYERLADKPARWLDLQKRRWQDREHLYYKCACGAVLRVPKKQGRIEVVCPNCHTRSMRRS